MSLDITGLQFSSIQNGAECTNLLDFLQDRVENFEIKPKNCAFITVIARLRYIVIDQIWWSLFIYTVIHVVNKIDICDNSIDKIIHELKVYKPAALHRSFNILIFMQYQTAVNCVSFCAKRDAVLQFGYKLYIRLLHYIS